MTIQEQAVSLIRAASRHTGIPASVIHSTKKTRDICEARWACWLVMRANGMTLQSIAKSFRRHHGAVIHGLKQADLLDGRRGDAFKSLCEAVRNHSHQHQNK